MSNNDKSTAYVPVLITWQEKIIIAPASLTRIALLLAMECMKRQNGGRIEDARHALEDERIRGLYGLNADDWAQLQQEASPFWHFEGDTMVVDFYSAYHEQQMRSRSNAGRIAGLASGKARSKKSAQSAAGVGAGTFVERPLQRSLNNKRINILPNGSNISKDSPPGGGGEVFCGDNSREPSIPEDSSVSPEETAEFFRQMQDEILSDNLPPAP